MFPKSGFSYFKGKGVPTPGWGWLVAGGLAAVGIPAGSNSALASGGFIRVDSSGFLKQAADRGDSSSTIVFGPDVEGGNGTVTGKLDARAITFLADRSSFTVEAANAYVATSRELMPHHQVTLGRRLFDWSAADDAWDLGLWSPRFNWDPLRPERLGNTGLFYTYDSAAWRLIGFASPLAMPERGFPIRQEKGKLVSTSPDWIPPYDKMVMMNRQVDIQYSLDFPRMSELVMVPGAGFSVRYGETRGPWANVAYGVLPMHQVDIAVEAGLRAQADVLEVTLHPRILFHHLATAEAGFKAKRWSVWFSESGESPLQKSHPPGWMAEAVGPALITSAGCEMSFPDALGGLRAYASALAIQEKKPPVAEDDIALNMPSRFPYTRAWQVGGRWTGLSQVTYDVKWTVDIGQSSNLLSFDVTFNPGRAGATDGLTLGLGTDFFSSVTNKGLIGQYAGNDRVRGRIAYAF